MSLPRTPIRTPNQETEEGNENENAEINELRRSLAHTKQVLQQLQQTVNQPTTSDRLQNLGMVINEGTIGNYLHFSIRDALEAVPNYDGGNIPFVYFVEGCEEALSMIAPSQEMNLVRAIRNKLKGDAHRTILGKTFNNMQELVEFLRTKYGPRETVYEAQGRLAYLCQKKDEKVVTYANRVRELGKRILDAQKRETGSVSAEFRETIEKHLKTSFLRGLNKEIIISKEGTFEEIESRAIEAEKELETINMIRRIMLVESAPAEKKASTRRIEAETVVCQYCHKKGHTADKCWQVNKPRGNNENRNRSSYSRNNVNNNSNYNNNNRRQPSFSGAQNSNNQNFNNQNFNNQNFNNQNFNNQNPNNQNFNNQNFNNQNATVTCRYCKKPGHTLEECRKRAYNNGLRQNSQPQGNEQIPARFGAAPGNTKTRPARVIAGETESVIEQ